LRRAFKTKGGVKLEFTREIPFGEFLSFIHHLFYLIFIFIFFTSSCFFLVAGRVMRERVGEDFSSAFLCYEAKREFL